MCTSLAMESPACSPLLVVSGVLNLLRSCKIREGKVGRRGYLPVNFKEDNRMPKLAATYITRGITLCSAHLKELSDASVVISMQLWKSFSLQFPFLQDLGSSIPSCLGWPELQFRSPHSGEMVSAPWSLLDLFALNCEWVNALQIKTLEEVQLTSECCLSLSKVLTTLVALWYLYTGLFRFDGFIVVFKLLLLSRPAISHSAITKHVSLQFSQSGGIPLLSGWI